MNVYITDEKRYENLSIIDPESGTDWITDLVTNTGALTDGQFVYNKHLDAYRCNLATYLWWQKIAEAHEKLGFRLAELRKEFGEEVDRVVHSLQDVSIELEDIPQVIGGLLDEHFGQE